MPSRCLSAFIRVPFYISRAHSRNCQTSGVSRPNRELTQKIYKAGGACSLDLSRDSFAFMKARMSSDMSRSLSHCSL